MTVIRFNSTGKLISKILAKRREIRLRFCLSKLSLFKEMKILDIGCGKSGRSLENFLARDFKITGIDLFEKEEVNIYHPGFNYIKRDAKNLSIFDDGEFDVTFCIGMLEHICDRNELLKIAGEIRRISKQYVIIVPSKWAWIEPHFKLPFFSLYPYFLKLFLANALNLHDLKKGTCANNDYIKNHYQWFSLKIWSQIFPESKTYLMPTLETVGIIKSLQFFKDAN